MKRKGELPRERNKIIQVKKRFISESESLVSATSAESEDLSGNESNAEDNKFQGSGSVREEAHVKDGNQKKELYKPPTTDELNELRETETLFQSGLMRLQIAELLAEVRLGERKRTVIENFISKLSVALMQKIKETIEHKLTDVRQLNKKNIKYPLNVTPVDVKGMFKFLPPKQVHTVGSFPLKTSCKSTDLTVDVAIVIPKECLQAKDHLNQRYLRKRALYLGYLAAFLRQNHSELIADVSFTYERHMKPSLLVKPAITHGRGFSVKIHATVENDFFRLSRFHINKSNVRTGWYYGTNPSSTDIDGEADDTELEGTQVVTPHYNMSMLSDMTMMQHQLHMQTFLGSDCNAENLRDAIILLKVWAHQRHLDLGVGSFNGYLAAAFIIYLLGQRKVNATMSSYQIFRCALVQLVSTDWIKQGIAMTPSADLKKNNNKTNYPSVAEFLSVFDVVFVDETGYMNLCADVTKSTYALLKYQAQLSLNHMDGNGADPFQILFMMNLSFTCQFDIVFHISDTKFLQNIADKSEYKAAMLDLCGDGTAVCLSSIFDVLSKSLNERVKLIALKPRANSVWQPHDDPPCSTDSLTFGILLDSTNCNSLVDRGPPADTPEAAEFREFWGETSEIRRFQDGSICEAVVWPSDTLADRRMIVPRIIKHILVRHCSVDRDSISTVCNQLDSMLRLPLMKSKLAVGDKNSSNSDTVMGTGEEVHGNIVSSCDRLGKILRSLSSLPLTISSIQGLSASSRYAEVFPPAPMTEDKNKKKANRGFVGNSNESLPVHVQSMDVVCMLEGSGKWPEDREAVQRVKAALYVQLATELRDTHRLNVAAYTDHVVVFWDGYVFRVILGYMREIQLCKTVLLPNGMISISDTPESLELERKLVILPKLNSILHGIYQQHNSYCVAVRLAKRWLGSQLLLQPYINEETVELIVAYLYISAAPYDPPRIPVIAFLRFLHLLSSHDWQTVPLIINLNNEFTKTDYIEIQTNFSKNRSSLPLMFIATPGDSSSQRWTKHSPSAQILNRVAMLAAESLRVLEGQLMQQKSVCSKSDFKTIFRPPIAAFDVIIYLNVQNCSRRHQAIDYAAHNTERSAALLTSDVRNGMLSSGKIPLVDFDPVQFYLQELRETFEDLALFFHDTYGGSYIGVVWKPPSLQSKKFKVFNAAYSMPEADSTGKEVHAVPNLSAVIEDFKIIGHQLVDRIETKET